MINYSVVKYFCVLLLIPMQHLVRWHRIFYFRNVWKTPERNSWKQFC